MEKEKTLPEFQFQIKMKNSDMDGLTKLHRLKRMVPNWEPETGWSLDRHELNDEPNRYILYCMMNYYYDLTLIVSG